MPMGAGISFVEPSGTMLFVKRSGSGDYGDHWAFPGGHIEPGETPEQAAGREAWEETGAYPFGGIEPMHHSGNFVTFRSSVPAPFEPQLNHEHTEYQWAHPSRPPRPLHPGVSQMFETYAMDRADHFALDRASVRNFDVDGRLHVNTANISKANICPYVGREIPDNVRLGLDPNKVYRLLRHPDELKKAAPTFNNLPILSRHVPVSAHDHQPDLVVGSTGTDAEFNGKHLKNSLVVWSRGAIDAIESEQQKELSCGYRYRADMTPGVYDGERYDGVMRDIVGNHVALVREGRAGPDVVIGDERKEFTMADTLLSQKAVFTHGAVLAFLAPKMAQDEKLDLTPCFVDITAENYSDKKAALAASVAEIAKPKLATDMTLEDFIGSLAQLFDVLEGANPAEPLSGGDDDDDEVDADGKKIGKKFAGVGNPSGKPPQNGIDKPLDGQQPDPQAQQQQPDPKGQQPDPQAQQQQPDPKGQQPDPKGGEGDKPDFLKKKQAADEKSEKEPEPSKGIEKLTEPLKEPVKKLLSGEPDPLDTDISKDEDPDVAQDDADSPQARVRRVLEGKISAEDMAAVDACFAHDESTDIGGDGSDGASDGEGETEMSKSAMDAAIAAAVEESTKKVVAEQKAVREAEKVVRPYVGEIAVAYDSADAVYEAALNMLGIKTEGIHASAFPALLAMQPLPGAKPAQKRIAQDSASAEDFAKRFPETDRFSNR